MLKLKRNIACIHYFLIKTVDIQSPQRSIIQKKRTLGVYLYTPGIFEDFLFEQFHGRCKNIGQSESKGYLRLGQITTC